MKRICLTCRKRWRQHGTLCRTCARKAGVLPALLSTFERERQAVERLRANDSAVRRVEPSPSGQRPTRVIDGIEYEVTFDGAVR